MECPKRIRFGLAVGWLFLGVFLCSLDLLFDTSDSWDIGTEWHPVHVVGGSIFMAENLIVAVIAVAAFLTRRGRMLMLVLCCLVSFHWLGVSMVAWTTLRLWRVGLGPSVLATVVLLFIASNIWILTRYQLRVGVTSRCT